MTQGPTNNDRYEPTVGIDAIHEILKEDRRRYILRILQRSSPLQTNELINAVARREYGSDYTDAERTRIRVSLHQAHLPKLIDHRGIVERGGEYELGPTAGALVKVLDCSEQVAGVVHDQNDPDENDKQYSSVTGWMDKIGLN